MDRQVFGNNVYIRTYQVAAADTEDYVLVPDGFHPALTRDYWGSWTYGFTDTAKRYRIDYVYLIPGFVHPAHDLILLGSNAPKLKGNPPFPPGGHLLRSKDGGTT